MLLRLLLLLRGSRKKSHTLRSSSSPMLLLFCLQQQLLHCWWRALDVWQWNPATDVCPPEIPLLCITHGCHGLLDLCVARRA